jgi:hypothetical protein
MFNKNIKESLLVVCCLIFLSASFGFSQNPPTKKNHRTSENTTETAKAKKNVDARTPVYFYEFSRPEFPTSRVTIEHDENGRGKISFLKKDFDEAITDPIELSAATLEKVKTFWQALNFLESDENYQFEKDYSHLGIVKIRMKKDGRERIAEFNWTTNKDAKGLMDEYRKIGNQYIWMFDINVSRENQPLESPRMMNSLDSMLRRNEISDANQMIPFLKELENDERIPLISRNHANRLVTIIQKQIEKERNKN